MTFPALRGLLLLSLAFSLSGCIVITPAHRHHGPPRLAVEIDNRQPEPPRGCDPRYERCRRW